MNRLNDREKKEKKDISVLPLQKKKGVEGDKNKNRRNIDTNIQ